MPENKQRTDVESQTSPIKETSPQVSVSSTEPILRNQTRSALVPILNDSKKPNSEIQRNENTRDSLVFGMILMIITSTFKFP